MCGCLLPSRWKAHMRIPILALTAAVLLPGCTAIAVTGAVVGATATVIGAAGSVVVGTAGLAVDAAGAVLGGDDEDD